MTGYAVTTHETGNGTLTIELKSVNSRFLDLQFRINDDLRALEPQLREAIMARITRGKVECRVSFGRKVATTAPQTVNTEVLHTLSSLQNNVLQTFSDARPLSVSELLRWPGVLEESEVAQDTLSTDVAIAMQTTMNAFVDSRHREGAALEN